MNLLKKLFSNTANDRTLNHEADGPALVPAALLSFNELSYVGGGGIPDTVG